MQKTVLKNYAKLLARVGLNVQKGQEVIITAGLDQPGFVAYAAEECYRAGASRVRVEWSHQPLARLGALCKSEEVLSEVRPWQEEKLRCEVRSLPAREQQVLALRFSRDLTQQQVSRIIGVSQVQVSRIEKRAIQALREKLTETE